ncbi:hypothetical protein IscW_ISCW001736 [Ixodes scapularis]|uniref:Uncharacterized protein n=1 Tax=Ixodes scapularis TaxID=6945 RepID=B7P4A2_IXOSC|nr:hypothetical protein IscW_ISCW001736 [Ixodes scapularis]|eukprot:XP_002405685.1 hypothetical protein IscW_ISCW001736 [Ixodes scapularis]
MGFLRSVTVRLAVSLPDDAREVPPETPEPKGGKGGGLFAPRREGCRAAQSIDHGSKRQFGTGPSPPSFAARVLNPPSAFFTALLRPREFGGGR